MTPELAVIEGVMRHPDLVTLNIRPGENGQTVCTTMIIKGSSEWCRGEGKTVSEAVLSLGENLRERGFHVAGPEIVTRPPMPVTTRPAMPGLTRRMPGV